MNTEPRRCWSCALSKTSRPSGLLSGPGQPPPPSVARTNRTHPLLPVQPPRRWGRRRPPGALRGEARPLLSPWIPAPSQSCPFPAATSQTLRGSLRGRKGKMIFKTKYLQQQNPLGSPDLCDVIYVGEGGGLRRGNQQCTTSIPFVL